MLHSVVRKGLELNCENGREYEYEYRCAEYEMDAAEQGSGFYPASFAVALQNRFAQQQFAMAVGETREGRRCGEVAGANVAVERAE